MSDGSLLNDPALRRGIPLMRARTVLVAPALWQPALKASAARASASYPDEIPGDGWRYKVLTPPSRTMPPDFWATWEQQQTNDYYRAEAARQTTFSAVSLDLGKRLARGKLHSFGRVGSVMGEWAEVPAAAWSMLRVPFSPDFQHWHQGHVVGANLDLWDVRLIEPAGISLAQARFAYGPAKAASVVLRAVAFGAEPVQAPPKPGSLDEKMLKRSMNNPNLNAPTAVEADELATAWKDLDAALFGALKSGVLVAHEAASDGTRRLITMDEWREKVVDWDACEGIRVFVAEGQAEQQAPADALPVAKKRGGGPRPKYNWAQANAVVLSDLENYGSPENGDGRQADLERLVLRTFPPDSQPSESLVREKVVEIIDGFRLMRQGQ